MKYDRNKKSLPRITRYDYKDTRGWVVRFLYRGELLCNKLFSDKVCGGKLKAKKAAIEYEKEMSEKYSRTNIDGRLCKERFYFSKARRNNKNSDIAGVFKISKPSVIQGKVLCYWVASIYRKKYNPIIKGYSVQKYGEREAFELARDFRLKTIEETFGKKGCVRE